MRREALRRQDSQRKKDGARYGRQVSFLKVFFFKKILKEVFWGLLSCEHSNSKEKKIGVRTFDFQVFDLWLVFHISLVVELLF